MGTLRQQKNELRSEIHVLKDRIMTETDEETLTQHEADGYVTRLHETFDSFEQVCNEIDEELHKYNEITKLTRLQKEVQRVEEDYQEALGFIKAYTQRQIELQDKLTERENDEKDKMHKKQEKEQKRKLIQEKEETDMCVAELEQSLHAAKLQQQSVYEQLELEDGELDEKEEERQKGTRKYQHTDYQDSEEEERESERYPRTPFRPRTTSTPFSRYSHSSGDNTGSLHQFLTDEPLESTHRDSRYGTEQDSVAQRLIQRAADKRQEQERRRYTPTHKRCSGDSEQRHEDPERYLKRMSLRKYDGNKRDFETWFAYFTENVGRHESIPDHKKLLRLYDCLEDKALAAVEDMGYTSEAYPMVINRLRRKFGGEKRELNIRMEALSKFKGIREDNADDLEKCAELLDSLLIKFWKTGHLNELGSGSFYHTVLRKMNRPLLIKYHSWHREKHYEENVHTLYQFINQEAEIQVEVNEEWHGAVGPKDRNTHNNTHKTTTGRSYVTTDKPERRFDTGGGARPKDRNCKLCGLEHGLWQCKEFRQLGVAERWTKVKELKGCFRCLSTWHFNEMCPRKSLCEIDGCKSNHNRLLHFKRDRDRSDNQRSDSSGNGNRSQYGKSSPSTHFAADAGHAKAGSAPSKADSDNAKTSATTEKQGTTFVTRTQYVALRTVPVLLKNGSHSIVVNALMDEASTITYMNESVAEFLHLKGDTCTTSVRVVNDQCVELRGRSVKCKLQSLYGGEEWDVNAKTAPSIVGEIKVIDWSKNKRHWRHLQDIKFPELHGKHQIDLLIGLDHFPLHDVKDEIKGKVGKPVGRLTPLGWTCLAPLPDSYEERSHCTYFTTTEHCLNDLVRQMWEMEISSPCDVVKPDDKLAEKILDETMIKKNDGYEVGLPWKCDRRVLPDNYKVAESRLKSLERKLLKNPELGEAYHNVLMDYVKKGYMRKISAEEIKAKPGSYLAHFAIERPDRDTTKVRVVFDASAECNGISLNDTLLVGPKLQTDLVEVLQRFRRYPVAVVSDITEMYLQIYIREEDRPVLRLLWRDLQEDQTISVYEGMRLWFGLGPSPYIASKVAKMHAAANRAILPRAVETIEKSTYMDDSMDSVLTTKAAIQLVQDLKVLWKGAGMTPKKWMSNDREVLKTIPVADRMKQIELEAGTMPTVKTLGISWQAEEDQFTFKVQSPKLDMQITKRNFLSKTASLFDPLGFVTPYIICARVMLQELWSGGLGWDDPVPEDFRQKAVQWFEELEDLTEIKIPRVIQLSDQIQGRWLHVFVDASLEAYGAVAYAVYLYDDGSWSSRFVASRVRVAPLSAISVPRLELMAAIVGVRLAETSGTGYADSPDNLNPS